MYQECDVAQSIRSPHQVLAGCGGGSVMTLTFPFIDDVAPARHKTLWFGVLGLTQPVGIAVGYIAMGQIASAAGWRMAFYAEVWQITYRSPHSI